MDAHISEKSRSKMAESMNELHGKMTRLFDVSALMQKHLDKEDRIRFSEWLSTTQIREHHDLARHSLYPGSGTWLKHHKEYQRWLVSSSSAILMIHGVRGCGKSSLFSQIVDTLSSSSSTAPQNRPAAPCAYFYCAESASEPDRSDPTAILRCILRQLGEYPDPHTVNSDVWSAYDRRLSDAVNPTRLNMDDCVELILAILDGNPAYIGIDAIDEIPEESRAQVTRVLQQLVDQAANVLKVFITSRDNSHVEAILPQVAKIRISPDLNQPDVSGYIRQRVRHVIENKRLLHGVVPQALVNTIIQSLVAGAGEM